MRRLGSILLVLAAWGIAAPTAGAEEIPLLFATANPPAADLNTRFMHPWADRITAESKGVLHIDTRDATSIANLSNAYDRVMDDVVQIAFGIHVGAAGAFPGTTVAQLPSFAESSETASVALWRLYKSSLLQKEYDQIVPLVMVVFPSGGLHFRSPIKFPELKGLKVIAAGKNQGELLESFGAAPITLLPSDYYQALQRGTADGVTSAWTTFQPFKLYEVTNYHVDAPFGRGTAMIFMKKSRFLGLPPAARNVIEANSGEGPSRAFGEFWDWEQTYWRKYVAQMKGQQVVDITPAEIELWQSHAAAIDKEWIASTPNGAQVLARYREILSELKSGH
jgi:TRAP-type C4-dicarboxylate transport system substrate-binding protein